MSPRCGTDESCSQGECIAGQVCDLGNIQNAVSGANYSDCGGKLSYETCVPECSRGYEPTEQASIITLDCFNANGFDGSNTLECEPCGLGMIGIGNGTSCIPCDTKTIAKFHLLLENKT